MQTDATTLAELKARETAVIRISGIGDLAPPTTPTSAEDPPWSRVFWKPDLAAATGRTQTYPGRPRATLAKALCPKWTFGMVS
jgi:hypothetical protein